MLVLTTFKFDWNERFMQGSPLADLAALRCELTHSKWTLFLVAVKWIPLNSEYS